MKLIDDNGKEYEISEEIAKQLTQEIEKQTENKMTGWERVNAGTDYYCILANSIGCFSEDDTESDKISYDNGNYFSTEEKAEEIDFKQTLFRKLQKFSDEHGGEKIDWNNLNQPKFYIYYDYERLKFYILTVRTIRYFGQVYFISREVAEQALEEFSEDLEKYFREY